MSRSQLGALLPFLFWLGTKIDYRKKGSLIVASLLEGLVVFI